MEGFQQFEQDGLTFYYRLYKESENFPKDLSVIVCCLTQQLQRPFLKSVFKKCGKIKEYHFGQMKRKSKLVHFSVLIFKDIPNLENLVQVEEEAMEEEGETEIQMKKHQQKMQEDGFTVVQPKKGQKSSKKFIAFEEMKLPKKVKNEILRDK